MSTLLRAEDRKKIFEALQAILQAEDEKDALRSVIAVHRDIILAYGFPRAAVVEAIRYARTSADDIDAKHSGLRTLLEIWLDK